MTKRFGIVFAVSFFLALSWCSGAEKESVWEINSLTEQGEFDYDLETGVVTATKGVVVKYGNTTLTANRMVLNQKTGDVRAEGVVILRQDEAYWRGERLDYNFITKQIAAGEYKFGAPPYFVSGMALTVDQTNQVYTASDSYITTDDVPQPVLRIRTSRLTIIPGKSVEARHARVYLGDVPVFYWPYYKRNLDRESNNFRFTPGYRSVHGPYLLSRYNWFYQDNLSGTIHLDYRQKRGVGFGPDFKYDLTEHGDGEFRYYYLNDDRPGTNSIMRPIDPDRQRIYFSHKASIRDDLTAKVAVRYQSDEFVIRDFFESEYRNNIQPNSFAEVNKLWPNFSLNVLAQPQINDFFETVERLPDVKLTAARQQLGESPLFYEGENSIGYFHREFAYGLTNDYSAVRADSFHQILLPRTFFGWLNVTPRAGGRYTYYSQASGLSLEEENRFVFNTGAEVSMKASRVWRDVQSSFWDVNELRHIVIPSLNYAYIPDPNARPRELPQFDTELQSFRLLPIDFPDYNSIDSIDGQNVFRFGFRNKLQTKREEGIANLIDWAIFADYRLERRAGQTSDAELISDIDFMPRSWITLTSETRYDIDNGFLNHSFHELTLTPNNVWSLSLGHRYVRDNPAFGPRFGHNVISSSLYYRLNENWATRVTHHYEARDGTLEEQYYTVYRDMRSWTGALTFRVRARRGLDDDYTIAVTFSLKAFPRYSLGSDSDKPSLLLGS